MSVLVRKKHTVQKYLDVIISPLVVVVGVFFIFLDIVTDSSNNYR